MKEFDPEELAQASGKEQNPVYVAHQGKVYDLSASKLWKGGLHMKRHQAGNDLSADITAAPHTPEVLERFPQVGVFKDRSALERIMPAGIAEVLSRFPMLRRHPHPMVVHFPIALSFSTAFFTVLAFLTGVRSFETTAFHCLGGAILFTPLAILTGWFTWWLNYLSKPMRPVTVKLWCSCALLSLQVLLFVWRVASPSLLCAPFGLRLLYVALVLSLLPLISVIGWYGATMTFPLGKD
jgi:predicted heme/steroid binding protein/uncharacterized membrane protein